jgi:hypothetical protein
MVILRYVVVIYPGYLTPLFTQLSVYRPPNSWNFTRLGKINKVTAEKLREILGDGNVTITLSLPQE